MQRIYLLFIIIIKCPKFCKKKSIENNKAVEYIKYYIKYFIYFKIIKD